MKRDAESEIVVLELESENCPAKLPTKSKAILGELRAEKVGYLQKLEREEDGLVEFSPETILGRSA